MKKVVILILLAGCAAPQREPQPCVMDPGVAQAHQRVLEYNRTHKPMKFGPGINYTPDTVSLGEILQMQQMKNDADNQQRALRRIETEIRNQQYEMPGRRIDNTIKEQGYQRPRGWW